MTLATLLLVFSNCALSSPLLRCHVSYAGTTTVIETSPTLDPYAVESHDIGERFKFKAVMVGSDKKLAYIKLYAYFQTRHQNTPIHQATYLPPFKASTKEYKLTPFNLLYAGEVERELQYQCTLQGVKA